MGKKDGFVNEPEWRVDRAFDLFQVTNTVFPTPSMDIVLSFGDVFFAEEGFKVESFVGRGDVNYPLAPADGERNTVGNHVVPRGTSCAVASIVLIGDFGHPYVFVTGTLKDAFEECPFELGLAFAETFFVPKCPDVDQDVITLFNNVVIFDVDPAMFVDLVFPFPITCGNCVVDVAFVLQRMFPLNKPKYLGGTVPV